MRIFHVVNTIIGCMGFVSLITPNYTGMLTGSVLGLTLGILMTHHESF